MLGEYLSGAAGELPAFGFPWVWLINNDDLSLAQSVLDGFLASQGDLPRAGPVSLRVFSVTGRLVRTLVDGPYPAGRGTVVWDGRDGDGRAAAAGVYLYRLSVDGREMNRKMMLVK